MAGPQDDWNDEDHYPMHPSHPGWDTQRDPLVENLRRRLPWLWVALGGAVGIALFLRWLWGS